MRVTIASLFLSVVAHPAIAVHVASAQDTTTYVVWNHGRTAGEMRVVAASDSAVVRFRYQDRQRGPRLETHYRFDTNGRLASLEVRGLNAQMFPGESTERYSRTGNRIRWVTEVDSVDRDAPPNAFYSPGSSTPYDMALLVHHLLAQPQQQGEIFPVGSGRAFAAAETTVTFRGASIPLRLTMVDDGEGTPRGAWLNSQDKLFASDAGWFITVKTGAEGVLPGLRAIERTWHTKHATEL
ncbi:MAG: hypothetical protein ABIT38_14750, partial [Gemmatimonadaceae bacterium]